VSDEELKGWIEAARAGDEDAVRHILELYGQQVRRTVGRRMGPALRARADSEDVLQSAMVFALANLADFEFRGEAAFVGWLSAIAAQQVGQLVRHHGAKRRDLAREQRLSQAPPLRADDTTVSQAAARSDDRASLRDALTHLEKPDCDVVRLRSFDGLAFGEVAERLGLADQDAARYIYRRALKSLGRIMAGGTSNESEETP
jgi:RNA polymerase sigma-70 factor (subfamily 1)